MAATVPDHGLHAIVLANGDVPSRSVLDRAWPGWDSGVELVIAADGGARHAEPLELKVRAWIGDGDSMPSDAIRGLADRGASITRVTSEKDETDTELAVLAAVEAGATRVTILGALGGDRVDHALANLGLLAHAGLEGREATILGDRGVRISLIAAPGPDGASVARELAGRVGDLVSLLPLFGRVEGVRTAGLRYPLDDEPLEIGPARGVSNVRVEPTARVAVRSGRLLVIETPANLGS